MATGLVYPPEFLLSLKSLADRPAPYPPIRLLSDVHFSFLHTKHLLQMGAQGIDSILFPYLHGVEHGSPNMREYFCTPSSSSSSIHPSLANTSNAGEGGGMSRTPSTIRAPDYRGLIWVADDDDGDGFEDDDGLDDEMLVDEEELGFRRPSDTSIQSTPSNYSLLRTSHSSSSSATPSIASRTVTSLKTTISDDSTLTDNFPSTNPSVHIPGSFKVSELLSSSENRFITPKTPDTISLRNFDIQVAAYARISDVVVYSSRGRGLTRSIRDLAARIAEAHEALYQERSLNGDSAFLPPLYNVFILDCAPTSLPRHLLTPCPSFSQLEQLEMQRFTAASEFLPGIYLGNSADVPVWSNSEVTTNVFDDKNNPNGYDLVVECVDAKHVTIPSSSHLKKAEEHLSTLQSLWATGFMSTPPARPAPNAHSILHFLFPCSPSLQTPLQHIAAFISFIQSLIHPSHSNRRCKVLIYSQDGYTESSVLALTLLMAEKKCTLSEAYLELQIRRKRSFFVHSTDLPLLQKLQSRYHSSQYGSLGRSGLGWTRSRDRDRWPWSGFGKNDQGGSPEKESSSPLSLRFGRRSLASPSSTSSQVSSPTYDTNGWIQNPKFDGSLPSRILPFLYLGNLNHACNAYMLQALGITHVVSVGECALLPPENLSSGAGTLWLEEREGRINVLDVKNICDDGMDGLGRQLGPICDYIERARVAGGKVLVHCRVGVSRSATVTIAYIMRHLSLPLPDAYLLVRSRRLSVLIQPNIRLLFDLIGWEIQNARERVAARLTSTTTEDATMDEATLLLTSEEELMAKELHQALCWPFLAREIFRLNAKYIR